MPRLVSALRSASGRLSGIAAYFAVAGGMLRSAAKQRLTAPLACHWSTTARTPVGLVQGGLGMDQRLNRCAVVLQSGQPAGTPLPGGAPSRGSARPQPVAELRRRVGIRLRFGRLPARA